MFPRSRLPNTDMLIIFHSLHNTLSEEKKTKWLTGITFPEMNLFSSFISAPVSVK